MPPLTRLSIYVALLLGAGCTEAYSPVPQGVTPPAAKTVVPDCRPSHAMDEEGFALIVEILRRNGEVQRAGTFYASIRAAVEARLAQDDPGAPARLKPALDALFSGGELEKRAVCAFVRYDRAQPEAEAWDAWSLDPDMRRIHDRILGATRFAGRPAKAVDAQRRALVVRVLNATDLRNLMFAEMVAMLQAQAVAESAVDPTSSALQDFAINGSGIEPPSEEDIVDLALVPALDGVSDADLREFLAFAESREGRVYYQTLFEGTNLAMREWYPRLGEVLKTGVRQAEVARDPKAAAEMTEEARRLLDEVGTRTIVDEARTLLLRAEKLDPSNAETQGLLGRVALILSSRGIPYEDGQIRDRIDKMHPARPQDYAEAERYLRKALELDPEYAQAHLYLGRIRFQLSQDAEAAQELAALRKLDPKARGLAMFEADMAYVGGDYTKAERLYRGVLAAPERRAFDHHFALERLRYALAKQGREREFRKDAQAQLKRTPDLWDFRLQHAERLLSTDGTVEEVAALVEPVPDRWLPERKRGVLVRLQLLRAGLAAPAERPAAVRRAFEIAEAPFELVDATCVSRHRAVLAPLVARASGMQGRFADHLLACSMWRHDMASIEAILPLVERIDGPNEAMGGGPPLCSAAVLMDAAIFERLLRAKADPARRCGDGKTVRDMLTERATRAGAEPAFNASNRALLEILQRYDRKP